MKKNIFALFITLSLSLGAYAATCEVSGRFIHNPKATLQTVVLTNFEETTSAELLHAQIDFTLRSVAVNPDNTIEYITISGFEDSACNSDLLFNSKNIYSGVQTTCYGPGIEGLYMVSVSCHF